MNDLSVSKLVTVGFYGLVIRGPILHLWQDWALRHIEFMLSSAKCGKTFSSPDKTFDDTIYDCLRFQHNTSFPLFFPVSYIDGNVENTLLFLIDRLIFGPPFVGVTLWIMRYLTTLNTMQASVETKR